MRAKGRKFADPPTASNLFGSRFVLGASSLGLSPVAAVPLLAFQPSAQTRGVGYELLYIDPMLTPAGAARLRVGHRLRAQERARSRGIGARLTNPCVLWRLSGRA